MKTMSIQTDRQRSVRRILAVHNNAVLLEYTLSDGLETYSHRKWTIQFMGEPELEFLTFGEAEEEFRQQTGFDGKARDAGILI